MRARLGPLVATLASLSCGSEPALEPRSGVYDVTAETVANDCDSESVADGDLGVDVVRFADGRLTLGHYEQLSLCSGCVPLATWGYPVLTRDGESGLFTSRGGEWIVPVGGCQRSGNDVVAEVLDAETVHASVTQRWSGDTCGTGAATCAIVNEYTYTLREACDGCSLDELFDRSRAIDDAERPQ